jgi:hypothetical protein
MRVSDQEREQQAEVLREHAAEGRLTIEELTTRLDETYAAQTRGDLEQVVRDLPRVVTPGHRRARATRRRRELRSHLLTYLMVNAMLIGIWAATGADYFWPIWPLLGWGIGVASHAAEAYGGGSKRRLGGCHGSRSSRRLTA